jgi:hypothetical protein
MADVNERQVLIRKKVVTFIAVKYCYMYTLEYAYVLLCAPKGSHLYYAY